MSFRAPSTRITPEDVIGFFKRRGQSPSAEDASRWLSRQRRVIEEMMDLVIKEKLDDIFGEATLHEYPDPVFNQQWKLVDEAITDASDRYALNSGQEHFSSNHMEQEMVEVIRRMLLNKKFFAACITYEHEFGPPCESLENKVITSRTRRVHIWSENGDVTAELVENDTCDHEHEVFVPEKLRDLN